MRKKQLVLLPGKTNAVVKCSAALVTLAALFAHPNVLLAKGDPHQRDTHQTQKAVQQKTITGRILDKDGLPIQGVSVLIKGTSTGTVSDASGQFTISVPGDESILVFSSIGKKSQEINIGTQTSLTIHMEDNESSLDQVVVVAFGSQQKKTVTSSISTVDTKNLQDRPVGNVTSALQGQVPGLNIKSTTGQPGKEPTINIRGIGSLMSGTSPLVIIDGIPGSLSTVNPSDIAAISVLKDASASSLYGARAANGVILITTKQGKIGKATITYSGYVGIQKPTDVFQEADAYSYANAYNTALMTDALSGGSTTLDPTKKVFTQDQLDGWKSGAVASTDWRGALFSEDGFTQSHNLNISGGLSNDNIAVKNNFSIGYLQENGNVANTKFDRVTLRDNAGIEMGKFNLDLGLAMTYSKQKAPVSAKVGDLGAIISAINRQRPVDPIYDENGDWNITATNDTRNPVRMAKEGGLFDSAQYNIIANIAMSYDFTDALKLKFTNSVNYSSGNADDFRNSLYWATNETTTGPNSSTKQSNLDIHYLQQLDLTYQKDFGDHHLNVIVGGQQEYEKYKYQSGYRSDFVNNSSGSLPLGADGIDNSSIDYDWGIMGLFGRVNYDYKRRYLLELNAREDGSSRLSPGNNWGFFPSASAGWRISEENFMAPYRNTISELKLRGSYGELGNQNVVGANASDLLAQYYPYQAIVGPTGYYYVIGNKIVNAMSVIQDPNNSFTWEKTSILDVALEGSLFHNLVNFSVGYFAKTTRDMLMTKKVSSVNGAKDYVANMGRLRNSGLEVSLGINKTKADGISYNLNGNFSYATNKILDLGGNEMTPIGVTKDVVGYPLNAYYIYQSDGLVTKEEYLDPDYPLLNGQKYGDEKIVDRNGDGVINADDRMMVNKSSIPKWYYGLNFDVSYHNFGIAGMVQGAAGGWMYLGASTGYGFSSGYSITNWTIQNSYDPVGNENNYNTRLPRVSVDNTINAAYPSTTYLFNSSYIRLKNIRVYYTIPASLSKRLSMQSARIYISGQNLYTWSKLPKDLGIDPEISSPTAGYPLLKVYSFGLDITF